MSQILLPIMLSAPNKPEFQPKPKNTQEANDDSFSNLLKDASKGNSVKDKAFQEKPERIDKKEMPDKNEVSAKNTKRREDKSALSSDDVSNKNYKEDGNLNVREDASARDFLEKLGVDEKDIKDIIVSAGLSQDASLLELINSFDFQINSFQEFLDISVGDFLDKMGIDEDKVLEIAQNITKNQLGNESKTSASIKEPVNASVEDLFREIGLIADKPVTKVEKDLSADPEINDKTSLIVRDLLKKLGLTDKEISNVIDKSLESPEDAEKIKNLVLNKDIDGLKKLVSNGQLEFKISPKDFNNIQKAASTDNPKAHLLEKANLHNIVQKIVEKMVQNVDEKPVTELISRKLQSELNLTSKTAGESLSAPNQITPSGSGTNVNNGSMNNGSMNFAEQFLNNTAEMSVKNSSEITKEFQMTETAQKAVFERAVVDQIVTKVSVKMTGGPEEMKIHLEPPSLGSLKMKVSVEGKSVNATILADNNIAKEIIQSNIPQLKLALEEQGLKLNNISVLLDNNGSGSGERDNFDFFFTKDENQRGQGRGNDDFDEFNDMDMNYKYAGNKFAESGIDLII